MIEKMSKRTSQEERRRILAARARIGRNLRALRLARGMTLDEAGRALGKSAAVVNHVEFGVKSYRPTIDALALLFGVPVSRLEEEEAVLTVAWRSPQEAAKP